MLTPVWQRVVEWWQLRTAPGDGLVHCPECDTTKIAQYGMGSFQRSFQCENGHRFSVPIEGP